jgi:hypothetical protein
MILLDKGLLLTRKVQNNTFFLTKLMLEVGTVAIMTIAFSDHLSTPALF